MNVTFSATLQILATNKLREWRVCSFLLMVALLYGPFIALGQDKQLSFKRLTINKGLSQNTVFSIYQDYRGFMWFGTEDGLNRYDGYEFKVFKNELDKFSSLQNNQVNVITEDGQHQLIVGTAGGLSFFNRETEEFTNIVVPKKEKDLQSSNFITFFAFNGNLMWIGTYDGLKLYDLKTGNSWPITYRKHSKMPMCRRYL